MLYFVSILVAVLSVFFGKLTFAGGIAAAILGVVISLGTGVEGLTYIGIFFAAGVGATALNRTRHFQSNLPGGPRRTTQVLANGGLASLLSLCALFFPGAGDLLVLMVACSLSSATADTLSSELGIIYGSRHYHAISLKEDTPGADGVVSLEGTLIGAAATLLIAIPYHHIFQGKFPFWIIIAAGIIGNYADSVLGALLERRGRIGNDTVNLLNTCTGAAVGWLLAVASH